MKKIKSFEIVNHGYEHSQYFQGCGTFCTPFEDVSTGIGYSATDAYDDAIEGLTWDWDTSSLPRRPRGIRKADHVPSKIWKEEENEVYWRVSIRVASYSVYVKRRW